jgi:hypothetical protein
MHNFFKLILTPKHWGALSDVFQVLLSWNHNYIMRKIKKQLGIKSLKVVGFWFLLHKYCFLTIIAFVSIPI